MLFKKLAGYFEKLEETPSRLKMTEILAELFKEADAKEIGKICYLSLGRLVPLYERLEFQLAEKMVVRAIALAFGREQKEVARIYKNKGDLGKVVSELSSLNPKFEILSSKLSVNEVYEKLVKIAKDEGEGSQERKVAGLADVLRQVSPEGGKYVVRMVVRKLRLGFLDKTIIDALSWMKTGDKSLRDEIEAAYFVRADIGEIAELFKNKGVVGLKNFETKVGIPVMPALCQRLKTAKEMIEKMGRVIVEPKFDGTRVQIHMTRNKRQGTRNKEQAVFLKTFTRNMDETTHMFPELKSAFKQIGADSVILDSEAVGLDPKTKKLLSFQQTIVRKRKHGVEEASKKVPLKFFVFDVLYKDGRSLLKLPLKKRRKILEGLIKKGGVLEVTEKIETEKAADLRKYHGEQLKKGLEGVVIKKVDSEYVSGRRGWSWVKFKEAETAEGSLADTLDLIVMGYYKGKGKRTGFGIGAFLVGVKKHEKFLTVAKIGTGLTDEQWKQLKTQISKSKVKKKPKEYVVDESLEPDVWVEPKVVVEIAADNITRSPNHSAGLALRFPRLKKFRDDKGVGEVTTAGELRDLV